MPWELSVPLGGAYMLPRENFENMVQFGELLV